jgi:hypothetical protein
VLIFSSMFLWSQTGQLYIPRISMMPDMPSPFLMRDWKKVASDYDNFIFNLSKTGDKLPLSRLGTKGEYNYPDNVPVFLDSYVGVDSHLSQCEAINLLPAIVGASLTGIDKSNQNGINWVDKSKDFFNHKNGQNVYLNNYSSGSGSDWWYDVMPNVFFYQLYSLYNEGSADALYRFRSVADRWLGCVKSLGGSATPWTVPEMNYRSFNLATGLPLTTGVPEPEAAGSIAWILYNAYIETGERKYFNGAQQSLDFLGSLSSNPAYELQLAYGTLTAARMNAVEGAGYPLQKMIDWCFDRGDLRGWGSIVGNWNGYDVSGLIGEANDNGDDYAFVMNGFQQVSALSPLPKYDKRYARSIAKWILNVANASRLFYPNALPSGQQDSYIWSSQNDPDACIPYESMKEVYQGKSPFATGDAIRGGWATSNLSLYSGSGVGYLAGIISSTNIPEIPCFDLNKTDFYGDNSLPAFLFFNPFTQSKKVIFDLPPGIYSIYDAITEAVISTSASGSYTLTIPFGEVRLLRLFPAGIIPVAEGNKLMAGNNVLDYNYHYDYSKKLRIRALSTPNPIITLNSMFTVYCEPGNYTPQKTEWFINDVLTDNTDLLATFTSSATPSEIIVKCRISFDNQVAEDTVRIKVVERIPLPPDLESILQDSKFSVTGGISVFTAQVQPVAGEILNYRWTSNSGSLYQDTVNPVSWLAPDSSRVAEITLTVSNQDSLSSTLVLPVLVKDTMIPYQIPLIYYPFDNDDHNAVSGQFNATSVGVSKTNDARGKPGLAYRFTSGQNIIYTENQPGLNFTDAVTLSCWAKPEQLGSERYIISHGSWQQRYKLSITPEGRFRWTVKTNTGVSDLDGSAIVDLNRYYHITAAYTGYSLELYIDGTLDVFKAFTGSLLPSTKPITLGRMDDTENQYGLLGCIDEFKLWDREIPVQQITGLKNEWSAPYGINQREINLHVYPNPAKNILHVSCDGLNKAGLILLFADDGREIIPLDTEYVNSELLLTLPQLRPGAYFLKIVSEEGKDLTGKFIIL